MEWSCFLKHPKHPNSSSLGQPASCADLYQKEKAIKLQTPAHSSRGKLRPPSSTKSANLFQWGAKVKNELQQHSHPLGRSSAWLSQEQQSSSSPPVPQSDPPLTSLTHLHRIPTCTLFPAEDTSRTWKTRDNDTTKCHSSIYERAFPWLQVASIKPSVLMSVLLLPNVSGSYIFPCSARKVFLAVVLMFFQAKNRTIFLPIKSVWDYVFKERDIEMWNKGFMNHKIEFFRGWQHFSE